MIEWEEKYVTGVEEIDHQHKWLFDFVNDLEKQLRGEQHNTNTLHILNSMKEYARKHFQYEEKCMYKYKCPAAAKNKSAHAQFLFAYNNFMERYEREGHSEDLAWRIHAMVEKWITNHICQIDMQLQGCVKDRK